MKKHILLCAAATLAATPAFAASWTRGYAINNYEPAFFYGGKPGGTEGPGSDCPKGTIPDNDVKKVLKTSWRTDAEIAQITKPVGEGGGGESVVSPAMARRGFRQDIETYINPFAAPDPGMQQVTGKIAEGFNLDGNAKTGGFTGTNGEKGIDNAFYRAWGCLMSFRGTPYHAYLSQRANDKMVDGLYTLVIRISGAKDPMNDDNVTVEIGYSPDRLVKDPNGNVVRDYSYRLVKSEQYTRLKGRIKNGLLETSDTATDLHMPAFSWGETNRGDAVFKDGHLRFQIQADGTLTGLAGGYRDWRDVYARDTFNSPSDGATRETYYHQNQIGMYYALKRNADGFPDPKTGQNTAISTAFRFTALPGYVVDPATPAKVDEPPYPTGARSYTRRDLFMKAQATKAIMAEQIRPAGRRGAAPAPDDSDAAPPVAPVKDNQQASNR
jgi:hypothetical protein